MYTHYHRKKFIWIKLKANNHPSFHNEIPNNGCFHIKNEVEKGTIKLKKLHLGESLCLCCEPFTISHDTIDDGLLEMGIWVMWQVFPKARMRAFSPKQIFVLFPYDIVQIGTEISEKLTAIIFRVELYRTLPKLKDHPT
jgi:hypothetical protein